MKTARAFFAMAILVVVLPTVRGNVTVQEKGGSVLLKNGIVAVEIDRKNGNVLSVEYRGQAIFAEPAYLDWHTGKNFHISDGEYTLRTDPATNGGEMAEVVITQKWKDAPEWAYDIALHHVLRRNDSGFYSYAVFSHPATYPKTGLGQSRMVARLNQDVFDVINVDDQRRRPMPPEGTPAEVLGPKESTRFTAGPFQGFITDKYHFSADAGESFVYGWAGTEKKIGCWIIKGSNEDHNGGPTKQRNTVHFPRMLLYILTCGHYGAGNPEIAVGEAWEKVYGPWMVYLNSGGDPDALWNDAKKKAAAERAAWPFAWMKEPAYPPERQRGTVTGQLKLSDPQNAAVSPAGAWVGLALPGGDWQQESKGYQFWTRAGQDGKFTIPNVRPGNYSLYAFANGVFDEFRHEGVRVSAGQKSDVGVLDWQPIHHGRQLWQIGVPDRTAKEFRHGDDYKQWGLWLKYPEEFPNDVNFRVGKSKERTDWNYAQVTVPKDGKLVGTTWTVSFNVSEPIEPGTAVLRFAFAGGQNAALNVKINGREAGDSGRIGTDNAMARAGIHGQYSQWDLKFDSSLLKTGENTIALTQREGGSPWKNVMYDALRLEVPDKPAKQ